MDAINHISSSQLKVDLDFPSDFNDSKEYVGILKTWQGLELYGRKWWFWSKS